MKSVFPRVPGLSISLFALALSILACESITTKGELSSDGAPYVFAAADEVDYIWTAHVTPGKQYEIILTNQNFHFNNSASIQVCDSELDRVQNNGTCYYAILAEQYVLSDDHRVTFTAPNDGDVVIVIYGIFGIHPVEGYVVTLTEAP